MLSLSLSHLFFFDPSSPSPSGSDASDDYGLTGNNVDDVIVQFPAREDVVAGQVHVLLHVEREILEHVALNRVEQWNLMEKIAREFVLNLLTKRTMEAREQILNRVVRVLISTCGKNTEDDEEMRRNIATQRMILSYYDMHIVHMVHIVRPSQPDLRPS